MEKERDNRCVEVEARWSECCEGQHVVVREKGRAFGWRRASLGRVEAARGRLPQTRSNSCFLALSVRGVPARLCLLCMLSPHSTTLQAQAQQ